MELLWPSMLVFLVLIPLFLITYLRLQQRRRQFAAKYGSLGTPVTPERDPGLRRHIPPTFFIAGLAILIFALARPQAVVSLPVLEGTVILAMDASGSMAADDFKPTRMEAAKNAAHEFVEHLPSGVQVGVVAFSDAGFSVLQPTNDQDALLTTIQRLTPQQGTSLGQGIITSLNSISVALGHDTQESTPDSDQNWQRPPEGSSIIILLSDGENNMAPDPIEAAQAAAGYGVQIYTIGIGDPAGTTLHINGFTVHTQLDEAMLQRISQITGGTYFNAQTEEDLHTIYQNITPQLATKAEKIEITSLLVGAGLLTMLIGGLASLLWFSRLP
jgi:Ca-activated chloride channel homolog